MVTAAYRLVNGTLLTEGRLEGAAAYDLYGRVVFIPIADTFDDHDASLACFALGFR